MSTNLYMDDVALREGAQDEQGDMQQYREGPVARAIEKETAKLPSDVFLWAAGGSALLSLAAQMFPSDGAHHKSMFIGQWVPTLLILGLYNKLVKLEGSDQADPRARANR